METCPRCKQQTATWDARCKTYVCLSTDPNCGWHSENLDLDRCVSSLEKRRNDDLCGVGIMARKLCEACYGSGSGRINLEAAPGGHVTQYFEPYGPMNEYDRRSECPLCQGEGYRSYVVPFSETRMLMSLYGSTQNDVRSRFDTI